MHLTLEDVKRHANIDQDYNGDDAYLEMLIEVAEQAVAAHCNVEVEHLLDHTANYSAAAKHALTILVATLYRDREAATFASASRTLYGFEYLVAPIMNYKNMTI